MSGEFSVFQWFSNDTREDVLAFVDVETATRTAMSLASSVGARLGATQRIIITDGGDYCCWEWKHEDGIVYPPEIAGRLKKGVR